jgi:hypothetical protein
MIAMCFNFFWLLSIRTFKVAIGFTHRAQKGIEFCVYRLGIAVLSALNEQAMS